MRDPEEVKRPGAGPNYDAFEREIDEAIDRAKARGHWPATIRIERETRHVVNVVIGRFQANGWRIQRVDDQRDGDYVQIEQP